MATKSPRQHHGQWPNVASAAQLPNVLGATIQDAALEVGDIAYVTGTGLYQCDVATLGAASWSQPGGGGGGGAPQSEFDWGGSHDYSQQAVPVEEVVGYGMLNGSQVGALTAYFRASWNPQFTSAGTAEVRLYDLGPIAAPGAPTLVATLTAIAGGARYDEQVLVVGAVPGNAPPTIVNTARLYMVAVYQSSSPGDSVFVGSAGITIR
jgi:hypothetical protein